MTSESKNNVSYKIAERILEIVDQSYQENSKSAPKVSIMLNNAIRIARLRNDFVNLLWLRYEEVNLDQYEHKMQIMLYHLNK